MDSVAVEGSIIAAAGSIIVALLTAVAGFGAWLFQRCVERREANHRRKEELYKALLTAATELCFTGDGAAFVFESQRAWLYATDEVLEHINAYLKAYVALAKKQERIDEAVKNAEGQLRLTLRKELQPKTPITTEWVSEKWELIGSRQTQRLFGRPLRPLYSGRENPGGARVLRGRPLYPLRPLSSARL